MAYVNSMRSASSRHFQDAELLFNNRCFDNAGYHYGFSAECALKGAMQRVGLSVDIAEIGGRPAFFLHFPHLKRLPVHFSGRLSQGIVTTLGRGHFLEEWDIKMRYSKDRSVTKNRCEKWRGQVLEFNNKCGGI